MLKIHFFPTNSYVKNFIRTSEGCKNYTGYLLHILKITLKLLLEMFSSFFNGIGKYFYYLDKNLKHVTNFILVIDIIFM